MRAWASCLIIAALAAASAAAQPITPQQAPPLRNPPSLALPLNLFTQTDAQVSECNSPPAFGATVTIHASANLPATDADTRVPFELRQGERVLASGMVNVVRATPPRVVLTQSFTVDGPGGTGAVTVRLGGSTPVLSAPISYSWTCLHAQTPPVTASTRLALPDFAFAPYGVDISMYRSIARPPYNEASPSEMVHLRDNEHITLWDLAACRGQNTGWTIVNMRVAFLFSGPGNPPATVTVEERVANAPPLDDRLNRHQYDASTAQFLDANVAATRAALTRPSGDVVMRAQVPASAFNRPGQMVTTSDGRRVPGYIPYNNLDVALPCGGGGRVLTLVIDPDNQIQEEHEDNNRIVIFYDLLG